MLEPNKAIKGWCIEYTHQGAAPELKECEVYTTTSDGLFTQPTDSVNLTRILTYGVSFFYELIPGVKGLLERLEDAKLGHQMAIAYIEDQIEAAHSVLRIDAEEKKRQQGGEDGAKPRC